MTELHVAFHLDACEYAVRALDVVQMDAYEGATPVPGARPFVVGVLQVRGRVVPVVDVRARFGLPPIERTLDHRIIVVQHEDRTVALLVDRAREVLHLDPASMRPPPPLVDAGTSGFVKAIAQVGARMFLIIDVPKVIGEESLDVA